MMNVLLVFAGGGAGSVLRYLLGAALRHTTGILPLATFLSNMSACAIFAIVYFTGHRQVDKNTQLLLLTGFCGGLSTFSTFGYETYLLFTSGMIGWAFLNILLSLLLGTGMFYLFLRPIS